MRSAAASSRFSVPHQYRSTIWCGSRAPPQQLCAPCCSSSRLRDGSTGMVQGRYGCCNVRYQLVSNRKATMSRRSAIAFVVLLVFEARAARARAQSSPAFASQLGTQAKTTGITRATFGLALKGVTRDQRVIAATKPQPEYGKPVGDYVNAIVSNRRIKDGQLKAREWAKTFDAVEKKFQVERWVLLALWGMESDFGAAKDRWDVFRSLATLGYVKYRHPYFRNELLVAMRIMQDGHIARDKLDRQGSGRMGV